MSNPFEGGLPPALIAALKAVRDEEAGIGTKMSEDDRAESLRQSLKKFDESSTFTHGMIVRPKQGVEAGYKRTSGELYIYIRPLSEEEREVLLAALVEGDIMSTLTAGRDCIIGRILGANETTTGGGAGAMIECLHTEAYLEPHPKFLDK